MERSEVEREIEAMIRASSTGGMPLAGVELARKHLGLSTCAAMQLVKAVYDVQPAEWRASVEERSAQRLLEQFQEELEARLTELAHDGGWRPTIRELCPAETCAWSNQLRARFELPSDIDLWQALWNHKHAQDAAPFHEEVPVDNPSDGSWHSFQPDHSRRSFAPRLTGTFADYQRIHGLPQDGMTWAVYEYRREFPRGLPLVLEMTSNDAARCLHAIYSVMVTDMLIVDSALRWVVCVFHHGTTRLIRSPDDRCVSYHLKTSHR